MNSQATLGDGLSYLALMRGVCCQFGIGAENAARKALGEMKFEGTADKASVANLLLTCLRGMKQLSLIQ